jgi:hypothetical protein
MAQSPTTVYVACEVPDPGAKGRQGAEPSLNNPVVANYPAGVELHSSAQVSISYADPPVTIIWHQVAGTGDTSIWVADKDLSENPILVTEKPEGCYIGTVTPMPASPTPTPTLTLSMTPTPTITPTPTGPTPTPQPNPGNLCSDKPIWIQQLCSKSWEYMTNDERQLLLDSGGSTDFISLDTWV